MNREIAIKELLSNVDFRFQRRDLESPLVEIEEKAELEIKQTMQLSNQYSL